MTLTVPMLFCRTISPGSVPWNSISDLHAVYAARDRAEDNALAAVTRRYAPIIRAAQIRNAADRERKL